MADKKITQLSEETTGTRNDIIVTVNDPTGTPVTKKMTLANLFKLISLGDISNVTLGSPLVNYHLRYDSSSSKMVVSPVYVPVEKTLTIALGAVSPNVSEANGFYFVINTAVTVSNPSGVENWMEGMPIYFCVKQDSVGGRSITWDSNFDFGDAGNPIISTTPNKISYIAFRLRGGRFHYQGIQTGF